MLGATTARPNAVPAGLNETLRARRKEFGLTQQQLAELSGVSTRFIHNLEAGKMSLQLDLVVAVAAALGLELTWRLRKSEPTNRPS